MEKNNFVVITEPPLLEAEYVEVVTTNLRIHPTLLFGQLLWGFQEYLRFQINASSVGSW